MEDDYLAEAQREIHRAEYGGPAAVAPPPQQIFLQAAPLAPAIIAPSESRTWLYIVLIFTFLLLTYISVQYAKDVRNRDTRSRRYNIQAYVDHSVALANRLPKGHAEKAMRRNSFREVQSSDESEDEYFTDK